MKVLRATGDCRSCGVPRICVTLVPDHTVHAGLTIITFGIWAIPWAIITAYNRWCLGWRCETCGTKLKR